MLTSKIDYKEIKSILFGLKHSAEYILRLTEMLEELIEEKDVDE